MSGVTGPSATPNPADSPLVSGTWALLFAGAPTAQAEAERARREGVVGSAISPRLANDGSVGSTNRAGIRSQVLALHMFFFKCSFSSLN